MEVVAPLEIDPIPLSLPPPPPLGTGRTPLFTFQPISDIAIGRARMNRTYARVTAGTRPAPGSESERRLKPFTQWRVRDEEKEPELGELMDGGSRFVIQTD